MYHANIRANNQVESWHKTVGLAHPNIYRLLDTNGYQWSRAPSFAIRASVIAFGSAFSILSQLVGTIVCDLA